MQELLLIYNRNTVHSKTCLPYTNQPVIYLGDSLDPVIALPSAQPQNLLDGIDCHTSGRRLL